jgi:MFS superfamily sulfate permease-like transporter
LRLLAAVLIAVVVSLGLVVLETILAPMPELGLVPGSTRRAYRSMRQYPDAQGVPGIRVFRVEAPIIFANAPGVVSQLRAVVYGADGEGASAASGDATSSEAVRAVVVDFSNVPYVDSSFLEGFADLIDGYKRAEVLLCFANPNSNVLHKLDITELRSALNRQSGEERDWIFLTVSDAVDAVKRYEPPIKPRKFGPEAEWEEEQGGARGEP